MLVCVCVCLCVCGGGGVWVYERVSYLGVGTCLLNEQ